MDLIPSPHPTPSKALQLQPAYQANQAHRGQKPRGRLWRRSGGIEPDAIKKRFRKSASRVGGPQSGDQIVIRTIGGSDVILG